MDQIPPNQKTPPSMNSRPAKSRQSPVTFETPVQFLKGVGPSLAECLAQRGIHRIGDLLLTLPRTYQDQRALRSLSDLQAGEWISTKVQVVSVKTVRPGGRARGIDIFVFRDNEGNKVEAKFFRRPFRNYLEAYQPGVAVRLTGQVLNYKNKLEFHHPTIEILGELSTEPEDRIIALYSEMDPITPGKFRKLISAAIDSLTDWPVEFLPEYVLQKKQWSSLQETLKLLHHPEETDFTQDLRDRRSPAHQRLAFEELFRLEMRLLEVKTTRQSKPLPPMQWDKVWEVQALRNQLPFQLTKAQERVIDEITKDLESGHSLNRLIQGDVGSGKTIVAFYAAALTIAAGHQTCLLAPTEILADQHFQKIKKTFSWLQVGFLSGSTKPKDRSEILKDLAAGRIQFLIGTHALIEPDVQFHNLGLCIIDEQHRFGVEQRAKLQSKASLPHTLAMTATPIPRTLALTVYGDLDVSVIDEKPPGRKPIHTRVVGQNKLPSVFDYMQEQVLAGRQAYVIYPLVEASDKLEIPLKDAEQEFARLTAHYPKVKFGLLHGRMLPNDKEILMEKFRQRELHALVSTTVIEVGVDVPNATLMIIENAERFGLSQLHQLRGRVGRGEHKSYCILILGHAVNAESRQRVNFLETTEDGFKISEYDLDLRGPGEFMGTRQSGLESFRFANIVRDRELLLEARALAEEIIAADPYLEQPQHQALKYELENDRRSRLASVL